MNIEPNTGDITVISLSETNAKSLAAIADRMKDGMLPPDDAYIVRNTQQGQLVVLVETDEKHYDRPEGGPGPAKDIMDWPTMEELKAALAAQEPFPVDTDEPPTEELSSEARES